MMAKQNKKELDIFQWCVEDITSKLKEIEGLRPEIKAHLHTNKFREGLFQEIFEKAFADITNPSTTKYDFRFINDWHSSESEDEKEYLLKTESELYPDLIPDLTKAYIEQYIATCIDWEVPFESKILTSYMAV
jgi:hypothetical protein